MFDAVVSGINETGTLMLTGQLTIENIEQVREALLDAISQYKDICVKIDNLEQIDFSFIQLFCAAHKSAEHQGKTLLLIPPKNSGNFYESLRYAGFIPHAGEEVTDSVRGFTIREER